jgi:hypothetical protein
MSTKAGYVAEHRLVAASHMGRCLTRFEVVHHVDHNPANNSPTNLMTFASQSDHKQFERHGSPLPIWSGSTQFNMTESFGA